MLVGQKNVQILRMKHPRLLAEIVDVGFVEDNLPVAAVVRFEHKLTEQTANAISVR